jgi:hypothetical protein
LGNATTTLDVFLKSKAIQLQFGSKTLQDWRHITSSACRRVLLLSIGVWTGCWLLC